MKGRVPRGIMHGPYDRETWDDIRTGGGRNSLAMRAAMSRIWYKHARKGDTEDMLKAAGGHQDVVLPGGARLAAHKAVGRVVKSTNGVHYESRRVHGVRGAARWHRTSSTSSATPARATSAARASVVPCGHRGLEQMSATCWFNAAFNALVLSPDVARVFLEAIQRLEPAERAKLANVDLAPDACPRAPSRTYVLGYMYRFFSGRPVHATESVASPNRNDHPTRLIRATHSAEVRAGGRKGGMSADGLKKLLKRTLPAGVGVMTYGGVVALVSSYKLIVYVEQEGYMSKRIPEISASQRVCSSIISLQTTGVIGHAICGYVCDGTPYVYDSNEKDPIALDWIRGIPRGDPAFKKALSQYCKVTVLDAWFTAVLVVDRAAKWPSTKR